MLKYLKVRDVKSPTRGTEVSSGIDFYVPNKLFPEDVKFTPGKDIIRVEPDKSRFVTEEGITVPGGLGVLIPTGLKVILPEAEEGFTYDLVLAGKSGVSVKTNLIVGASVIDNDYRGEFNIHLINPNLNPVFIPFGMKIVQGIVRKVNLVELEEISEDEFLKGNNTERGEGGFGSTGTN